MNKKEAIEQLLDGETLMTPKGKSRSSQVIYNGTNFTYILSETSFSFSHYPNNGWELYTKPKGNVRFYRYLQVTGKITKDWYSDDGLSLDVSLNKVKAGRLGPVGIKIQGAFIEVEV